MSVPREFPPDLIGLSGLYNTPDPLLRRLRLEDTTGHPITDLERYFKGKQVIVLYAGSEEGSVNLKELHRNLTSLVMMKIKTCALIYVSTDTDIRAPQRVLSTQPWLRMIFQDNSDFAPMLRRGEKEVEMEEVSRGEEFIQAGEIEMGVESVEFGLDERPNEYVRPLSRAALSAIMRAYATPSLAIYHVESHTFLAKNVRLTNFKPAELEKNYHTWSRGGTPSLRIVDVLRTLRIPILLALLAVVYRVVLYVGGERYNGLPDLIGSLLSRGQPGLSLR